MQWGQGIWKIAVGQNGMKIWRQGPFHDEKLDIIISLMTTSAPAALPFLR